jgi:large subunit ribosomal protein L3
VVTFFVVLTKEYMQLTSLVGKKIFQKQGFLQDGTRVPLTGVVVAGNFITQVKSADKEGYNAVQLGIGSNKKAKKAITNHSKKAGLPQAARFLREVRVDDVVGTTSGTEINVSDVFVPGDIINVTGVSKGKGFAGGVKRWGFKGGPRTHGQSDRERAPGSIGQTTTPGRVYRGKKMAGRMGQDTVTVRNLEVIEVTADGVLLIKGLVPGSVNSIVVIKKMGTVKNFVPLFKEAVEESVVEEAVAEVVAEEPVEAQGESEVVEETTQPEAQSEAQAVAEEAPAEEKPTISSSEGEQAPAVQDEAVKEVKGENK